MHHFKQFLLDMPAQALFRTLVNVFFPDGSDLPYGASEAGHRTLRPDDTRYGEAQKLVQESLATHLDTRVDTVYRYTSDKYGLTIDAVLVDRDRGGFSLVFRVWDGPEIVLTAGPQRHPSARVCANP